MRPWVRFDVRHQMKNLTASSLVIFGFLLMGCATSDLLEDQFSRELRELRTADVTQSPNSILVGEMFPDGRTLPVSDDQARRLQKILLAARPAERESTESGRTISPAPRLCALSLAGQTWYFMPPGRPVRFRLPEPQQSEFTQIMSAEFDLKD